MDSSKVKEFADDNFKFDTSGRKFSKRVTDTAGKGKKKKKNARYEQCLSFPTVISKDLNYRHVKSRSCFGRGSTIRYQAGMM